jgi:hypothetical protein
MPWRRGRAVLCCSPVSGKEHLGATYCRLNVDGNVAIIAFSLALTMRLLKSSRFTLFVAFHSSKLFGGGGGRGGDWSSSDESSEHDAGLEPGGGGGSRAKSISCKKPKHEKRRSKGLERVHIIYREKACAISPLFSNLNIREGFLQPLSESSQDFSKHNSSIFFVYTINKSRMKKFLP